MTVAADIADMDPDTALRIVALYERRASRIEKGWLTQHGAAEQVSWETRIDIRVVNLILSPKFWTGQLLASDLHSLRTAIRSGEPLDRIAERYRLPLFAVEYVKRRSERSAKRDAKLLRKFAPKAEA